MPRAEFGTAPFCGGSAASSPVISGAAQAGLGIAATAPKTPAQVNIKKCLNMILHSLQLFMDVTGHYRFASTSSAVADDRVGRPEQRMGVGEFGLAGGVGVTFAVGKRPPPLPQPLA